MLEKTMDFKDAPASNQAEVFCTVNNKRYSMLNATNVKAVATVSLGDVKVLGSPITGKKVNGLAIKLNMTVIKVSEMFDDIIETYIKTGYLAPFDVQVTNSDETTGIGKSTKIYKDCVISGDVLLSLANAEGGTIEQEIEAYAMSYETKDKYTTPDYMGGK